MARQARLLLLDRAVDEARAQPPLRHSPSRLLYGAASQARGYCNPRENGSLDHWSVLVHFGPDRRGLDRTSKLSTRQGRYPSSLANCTPAFGDKDDHLALLDA